MAICREDQFPTKIPKQTIARILYVRFSTYGVDVSPVTN